MIDEPKSVPRWSVWTGRALTGILALAFMASASVKLRGGPGPAEMMGHLGLPTRLIVPLAVLELSCVAIYLIPQTAVLGAILLTGYMGGAICSHLRVGDPFVVQALFGFLAWLALYLRGYRLRQPSPPAYGGEPRPT